MTGGKGSPPGGDGHVRMLLGVYLMGGLPEDDAAEVKAHLEVCATCKAEHDDLAPVAGWLGLLSPAQVPRRFTVVGDRDADRERGKRKGRARKPPGQS
jgi:anti-sigma factor RsiW